VEAVRRTLRAAKATVEGEGDRDAKLALLREVARSLFDTRAMRQSAVGDVLVRQPEAQQEEFFELFDAFIVRAYLQKLLFFRNPRFGYGRTVVRDEATVVHTLIKSGKDDYYVDYVMRWDESRWQATDIIVEGVSLLQNHREQFQSLLRSHTFDELLERLRRKVARQRARETT
jgi:phospholipid transport system substrate-binding protein